MMTCESFLETIPAASAASAEQLAHVRACLDCRAAAVVVDGDYLFRALGGEMLVPDGGVDAFVDGVMSSIAMREVERSAIPRSRMAGWQRWAIAAAMVLAVGSALIVRTLGTPEPGNAGIVATASPAVVEPLAVVASYDAAGATIVELPAETSHEPKIVMVFDETLPVDL